MNTDALIHELRMQLSEKRLKIAELELNESRLQREINELRSALAALLAPAVSSFPTTSANHC